MTRRRIARAGHVVGYLAAAVTGPLHATLFGRAVRAGWARRRARDEGR